MDLSALTWEQFQGLDVGQRAAQFSRGGREQHVVLPQQFGREELEQIGALATRIRRISKSKAGGVFLRSLLPHKRAMLYFSQPSSRTFLSFSAACQILGMQIGEVRDPSTSSELKGETPDDSVRTFSSYFDLIVMRSVIGGLAERTAWLLSQTDRPVPVINAGSGKDQHPTQALLDIYTLQRSFESRGGIDGKRVVFVGDLLRGRTVRSLALLLENYRDVELCFVAPSPLQISNDIQDALTAARVRFSLSDDLASELPTADAVYMTRVQDEWDRTAGESAQIDLARFCLGTAEMALLPESSIVMHPLPRRKEIATEVDNDPRAMYWRQMRNGMWVRVALIARLFGQDEEIASYALQQGLG
jgi:aspartate carbamoyltransferase catalytic subunit